MKSKNKIKFMTNASLVAAAYVVLAYVTSLFGLSSGVVQLRLSEAFCVLPAFTPAAIPGLFIGCFISNLVTGCIIFDVIFGSLATLAGAVGTYYLSKICKNVYLYTLPNVVSNTLIIPAVLKYFYSVNHGIWYFYLSVAVGELLSCTVLGTLLYFALKKHEKTLFK